ncbi:unnamed protein product [Rotaria sp. Silwood1]|nr:unnamed protein product [Rotaria sp. Silwood1]
MVTPDDDNDDAPCYFVINTRLRHVELHASILKRNDYLRLISILSQTIQRIENAIEQTKTEELNSDINNDNLEALVEAHLVCQNTDICSMYISSIGWRFD